LDVLGQRAELQPRHLIELLTGLARRRSFSARAKRALLRCAGDPVLDNLRAASSRQRRVLQVEILIFGHPVRFQKSP
jgi:hypothetical protein